MSYPVRTSRIQNYVRIQMVCLDSGALGECKDFEPYIKYLEFAGGQGSFHQKCVSNLGCTLCQELKQGLGPFVEMF